MNKQTVNSEEKTAPEGAVRASCGQKTPRGRRLRALWCVLIALAVAGVGFTAGWMGKTYSADPRLRELEWMLSLLESEHYREVDMDAVYEDLYDAVMPDIFSDHYTPEEYAQRVAESRGHNEGVGISLTSEGERVRIRSVVENSPAQAAGLAAGMYVLGYGLHEGEVQAAQSPSAVITFVRAQEGAFVLYAHYDPLAQADASSAYTLASAAYEAAYVVYRDSETSFAFRGESASLTETGEALSGLDASTAYIRLDAFDGNCAEEFEACLSLMRERGRTDLILDLRGNGGGYLSDLQSIASHLVKGASDSRPLVAYAQYRNGSRRDYYAAGNDYFSYFQEDSRICVLADEHSASASECLIGAMVDYGTIGYGDIFLRAEEGAEHCSTYGKGVMQSTFVSASGSAFQFTVARIYWPKGNCIHERGVTDEDGAQSISAPALRGERDEFLEQAVARICG